MGTTVKKRRKATELNNLDVIQIKMSLLAGKSVNSVARAHNVQLQAIKDIASGDTHTHIHVGAESEAAKPTVAPSEVRLNAMARDALRPMKTFMDVVQKGAKIDATSMPQLQRLYQALFEAYTSVSKDMWREGHNSAEQTLANSYNVVKVGP